MANVNRSKNSAHHNRRLQQENIRLKEEIEALLKTKTDTLSMVKEDIYRNAVRDCNELTKAEFTAKYTKLADELVPVAEEKEAVA